MKSFIASCVQELTQIHSRPEEFLLVIPSKRAKRYFFEEFVQAYNKPIFLPEILTIDELLHKRLTKVPIDKTQQLFLLYQVALKIPEFNGLSFESFLSWGPLILNDFEEMNRYLMHTEQVFKNLLSIKELDSWNLEEGKEISESQQQFLAFWEILPTIYDLYLHELKDRGFTTGALLLREQALNPEELFAEKQSYFIGFNALTTAEQKIISAFVQAKKGTYWVDVDAFYMKNSTHEAGMFHRRNIEVLGQVNTTFELNELNSKELNVEIIACPQVSGQVKVAATELSKLSAAELNSTLVLLADDRLIMPLLKNIPASVHQANVTVGLPLNQTPLKSFIDLVFSIQENKERFKTQSAYYKDLLAFFQHPFVTVWIPQEARDKITQWEITSIKNNRVFQSAKKLMFDPLLDNILSLLFDHWDNDYSTAIQKMQEISRILLKAIGKNNEFEAQILVVFQQGFFALENLSREGFPIMSLRTFKQFFNQHWSSLSLAYHGNPTEGVQIMGLLETRLLDFKNLIVLGLNEGALPPNNGLDSVIPMDLRKGLGLPTPREKQGLFSHHFYRLLHRAENVVCTYAIGGEGLGTAEPSRYLTQIEMELCRVNPRVNLVKKVYTTPLSLTHDYRVSGIDKRPQIELLLENYFSKKVSASAMLKYLQCPLDFYFCYLAELGEEETVEEDLEMSSMGKIIHSTLEELYLPFAERNRKNEPVIPPPPPLTSTDIQSLISKAPEELRRQFTRYLDNDESLIASGKNYLTFTVALEFVLNLLRNDQVSLQSVQGDLYIHRLEAYLTAPMPVEVNGSIKILNWVGFVDRIDRIEEKYRLVDYKSGKVKPEHVAYSQKEDVRKSFISCKHGLQLAVYAYLFEYNYGFSPYEKGIYAIQKSKDAFFPLELKEINEATFMVDFRELIKGILEEIYDFAKPFEHLESAKYCNYC
jgi:hypothetical protein